MAAHPSWFDYLTLTAIFVGPIAALFAQRLLDYLREKKNRRVGLYQTLMSLRATPLHPDHVRALNSLDSIFDGSSGKDVQVREAWGRVLAHLVTNANADGWQERLLDLRVDLYQAVGKAVGYDHSIEYLKNRIYTPIYFNDVEVESMLIRQGLARSLTNNGLKVVLHDGNHG